MTRKSILSILLAICVVMFSLYQAKDQHNIFAKMPQQEYMKDLIVTHYSEAGKIKDQIQAKYWAYLPANQLSTIEHPRLLLFKPNGAEWSVEAENGIAHHATLNSKISKLELLQNVLIERSGNNNFVPVIMQTEQIFYFPETEYIETDKFVAMNKPGLSITGVGLKSNLQKNLVTLLDKVTTSYEK